MGGTDRSRRPRADSSRGARTRVDPARAAAYDVLVAVRVADAYTNLELPQQLRKHGLAGRDAAFATELASGAIRLQGRYDPIIDACLTKPRLEAKVRDALRLGAHQLLGMRVPDHAAISTTVDLVRARVGVGPTGLVNAVLRKIAGRDLEAWLAQVAVGAPVARLAVAHSHPPWVVVALGEALAAVGTESPGDSALGTESPGDSALGTESPGDSALGTESPGDSASVDPESSRDSVSLAELTALLGADNESPAVTLVARPGRSRIEELPGEPTRFSPYGVVLAGGDPAAVPAVSEGRAGVQDEGSQLVALAMASAPTEGPDERWLDLCAGPGGKAALLAALAAKRGARIVANESQPHRADLVCRALGVAGETETSASAGTAAASGAGPASGAGVEEVTCADGHDGPWAPGSFDRVLVDAPCSGLGALRRRPEARWRRQPSDLEALVPLQRELLAAALDAVRPGGVVLYATCSPVLAETRDVVASTLADRSDVQLEPIDWDVPESFGPLPGTRQLWPHLHGTDAMYLALLRRR